MGLCVMCARHDAVPVYFFYVVPEVKLNLVSYLIKCFRLASELYFLLLWQAQVIHFELYHHGPLNLLYCLSVWRCRTAVVVRAPGMSASAESV